MKYIFSIFLFLSSFVVAQNDFTVARRMKIFVADFKSDQELGSIFHGSVLAEQFENYAFRSPLLLDKVLIKPRAEIKNITGYDMANLSTVIAKGRALGVEGVIVGQAFYNSNNLYDIQVQLIDIQKKNIPSSRRIINFAEVQDVPTTSDGIIAAVKRLIHTLEQGVFPKVDIITPDFDVVSIISINKDNFPEIKMRVSVVNRVGEPVNIPSDLFEVRENGNMVLYDIQRLTPQTENDVQLNILFAFDRSPSMLNDETGKKTGVPFQLAKDATINFMKKLTKTDKVKIVAFDYNVLPLGDYTANKSSYYSSLQNLKVGRGTGLFNIVKYCVNDIKDQAGDKVVILLTDGRNDVRNASKEVKAVTLEDGLVIARSNTIPVYAVGFGGVDDAVMKKIAKDTHSQYFKANNSKQLSSLYLKIHRLIENQYVITYKSLAEKFGKVKVSLAVKDDERGFELNQNQQQRAQDYKSDRDGELNNMGDKLRADEIRHKEALLKKEQATLVSEQKELLDKQLQLTNLENTLNNKNLELLALEKALTNRLASLEREETKFNQLKQELSDLEIKLAEQQKNILLEQERIKKRKAMINKVKENILQANNEILLFLKEKLEYINNESKKMDLIDEAQ